jgi:carotenoid cleavage dioxygenase
MPADNPFLMGNAAPIHLEGDSPDLVVRGEVPRDLFGAYYRNGANPQFAPRGGYMSFDGDGMIHAFFFEDGRVRYKNRWVRSERFLLERAAGEALFGSLVDPGSTHRSVVGKSSNTANTNVLWHAGRLLALWEAGLPTEIDPLTLETRGLFDFDGALTRRIDPAIARQLGQESVAGDGPGIMTAHPKIDPETGEMLFFGYSATPPCLVFNVASAEGELLRSEEIDVPFPSMMHDFIVTRDHVVFPIFPAVFDFEAMAKGTAILAWKPEKGTHLGVMPRNGGNADVRWFQSDPCFVFHPINGRTQGDRIVAELTRFDALPMFGAQGITAPTYWRWTIDLAGGSVKEEQLDDLPTEFQRIDERFAGRSYRQSFGPCAVPEQSGSFGFGSLVRYDIASGARQIHPSRPGTSMGEPVFVPRSDDAPDGDGFVLVLAYRDDEKRSDLLILDAQNLGDEPLAVVNLPVRVPEGFHGNWKPGS